MKKHWKRICGILLLATVVGGCAWYSRPVDIYALMPGLEPRYLYVALTDFSSFADPKKYTLSLTEEGPEHTELRQTLEALRFRRIPPWGGCGTGSTVKGVKSVTALTVASWAFPMGSTT